MASNSVSMDTLGLDASSKDNLTKKPERAQWSGKLEFLMSCISVSVGLGNIWRFPFIAYENGGGAFLIPYIVVLFVIGKPLYYMEALLGQFSSKNSVRIWSCVPAFLGVGYGEAFASTALLTYYSSLIALTVYYLIGSFQSELPWSYCRAEWGDNCIDSLPSADSILPNATDGKLQSSSELYFLKTVLREVDDISEGIGVPNWRLVLTLLGAWIVAAVVVFKGIKSLGKASYFLALFPYVILITILIRAATLEGAGDGIIYFLKPKWSELLNLKVWKEAVTQCFFSLSVAFGPIFSFSSYNNFNHNVYRDTMIVTTLDTFTSLLGGITIFGILGNLAHNLNADSIDDVVRSGTGLAFISYPDAIAKFQVVPQLFSVLFFFMLFVLGIGSLVALQSSVVTIICDRFKITQFWKVSTPIALLGFSVGIVYVTPGGQWVLNLVDYYAGTYVVFALAIFEVIGITWIYGVRNFVDDVEFMINRKVSVYWRVCWIALTPVLLIFIFIYTLVDATELTYSNLPYPPEINAIGWLLFGIGLAQFPLWGIWYMYRHPEGSWDKTFKTSLKPSEKWGPDDPEIKTKWLLHKQQLKDMREKERFSKNISKFRQKVNFVFGISQ